jgi:hypothetical protein
VMELLDFDFFAPSAVISTALRLSDIVLVQVLCSLS